MGKVGITETICRDAHQSLIATRMTTEEMLPALPLMDKAGYHALEVWGGATFDACLRFLNEDPWERLRKIRAAAPNSKLQMLFRGQNVLGYRHYADDVVEYFVQKSIANGIDIIRIFDALNDVRNLQTAINATKKEGGHVQAAISYTISPVHNNEFFVKLAKQYADCGADSICIKDMAGLLTPYNAYDLVKQIKAAVKVPLELHTHYTSGVASMTYLKAIEAGVDVVDCALSPMALGTSQPPTEPLVATLQGTEYDTGMDLDLLTQISDYFKPLREKYLESGLMSTKVLGVDINTLKYQVPGGMLSNLLSQLTEQGMEGRYEEVLAEVPRVRAELGYPPLVTPLSQMVGTQAVMNVISGERYKMVPTEIRDYVLGRYGSSPAPIDEAVREKILAGAPAGSEPISCRPADLIEPQLEALRSEISCYARSEEDVLSYALFPKQARDFLGRREDPFYDVPVQTVNVTVKA